MKDPPEGPGRDDATSDGEERERGTLESVLSRMAAVWPYARTLVVCVFVAYQIHQGLHPVIVGAQILGLAGDWAMRLATRVRR